MYTYFILFYFIYFILFFVYLQNQNNTEASTTQQLIHRSPSKSISFVSSSSNQTHAIQSKT
jgi:hypothetical protein